MSDELSYAGYSFDWYVRNWIEHDLDYIQNVLDSHWTSGCGPDWTIYTYKAWKMFFDQNRDICAYLDGYTDEKVEVDHNTVDDAICNWVYRALCSSIYAQYVNCQACDGWLLREDADDEWAGYCAKEECQQAYLEDLRLQREAEEIAYIKRTRDTATTAWEDFEYFTWPSRGAALSTEWSLSPQGEAPQLHIKARQVGSFYSSNTNRMVYEPFVDVDIYEDTDELVVFVHDSPFIYEEGAYVYICKLMKQAFPAMSVYIAPSHTIGVVKREHMVEALQNRGMVVHNQYCIEYVAV